MMDKLFLIRDPLKYVASGYMDTYTKLNTIQSGLVDNLEMNKTDLNILKKYMNLCKMQIKNQDELLTVDVHAVHDLGPSDMRFDRVSSLQFDKKSRTIYIMGVVINRDKNYYFTGLSICSPEITLYLISINESLPYNITFRIKNYFEKKDEIKDSFGYIIGSTTDMFYNSNEFFRNVEVMGSVIMDTYP